ncbi:MAG: hypothetical protein WKH64_15045 [Chloroflexia bacterium]
MTRGTQCRHAHRRCARVGFAVLDHDAADGWTQEFERASLVVYALSSGSVSAPDAALLTRIATIGLPVLVTTVGSPALVGEAHSLDDFNRLVNSDRYRVRRVKLPPEGAENQLVRAVLRELEAFDIALARRLPPFRPFVSAHQRDRARQRRVRPDVQLAGAHTRRRRAGGCRRSCLY